MPAEPPATLARRVRRVVAVAALAACAPLPASAQDVVLSDMFDAPRIDRAIWSDRHLVPDHAAIVARPAREGTALSLGIAPGVRPADQTPCPPGEPVEQARCDGSERNEIKVRARRELALGRSAYWGFSFHLDPIPAGAPRLVVGQLKAGRGGSPFLAHRFTGGVFTITVQDGNGCRVTIAQQPHEGPLPDPAVCQGKRRVEVVPHGPAHAPLASLPADVFGRWVDVVWHVRENERGRAVVQVWIDRALVAEAHGDVGFRRRDDTQYFKIGLYRNPSDYSARVVVDDFRRGPTRASVDPARLR